MPRRRSIYAKAQAASASTVHTKVAYICPHCARSFPTEIGRKIHIGRKHDA